MGFNAAYFKVERPFGVFRNHRWHYETLDTQATMNTANYFSPANQTYNLGIQPGDEIFATVWDTAVPTAAELSSETPLNRYRFIVNSVATNGALDVANGDALDATAPSGYSAVFAASSYQLGVDADAVGINVTGAEIGCTYAITITSTGGGTPIVLTGTVAAASFSITEIDCSGLTDGTLHASIVLTDEFGNAGGAVDHTATLVAA